MVSPCCLVFLLPYWGLFEELFVFILSCCMSSFLFSFSIFSHLQSLDTNFLRFWSSNLSFCFYWLISFLTHFLLFLLPFVFFIFIMILNEPKNFIINRFDIYRWFLICSCDSLGLIIPNNKTIEHCHLKVLFIAMLWWI